MLVPQNATYAYVGVFVEELVRSGVRHAVICPGSRSAPMSLTLAAHEGIKPWVLVDERSAAFFALGLAKATGEPVVLTCTSGTAAANFLPAVAEASQGRVPLIVLTTDRPPELQGVGAPQTMPQEHLYGVNAKWFLQMAVPEASETMLRYARTMACRAVATAQQTPQGPVHLNFPFREPLSNIRIPEMPLALNQMMRSKFLSSEELQAPFTETVATTPTLETENLFAVANSLINVTNGLIVAGPGADDIAIIKLGKILGWPVIADPLSSLRRNRLGELLHVIDCYDAFLRDKTFVSNYVPDVILRFGAMPTSKPFLQYLEMCSTSNVVLVDEGQQWRDPLLNTTLRVATSSNQLKDACLQVLGKHFRHTQWLHDWLRVNEDTRSSLREHLSSFAPLFEGRVFMELSDWLPNYVSVVVGNSMPIRDCDTFFWSVHPHQDKQRPNYGTQNPVYGNRGVNGIDGMTSTALGVAAGQAEDKGTVLVVGDLTFYHDLNGLLAAKKYNLNLTIIVTNNNGGGIFSFLPQASHHADQFEDIFGTPTHLDFAPVVQMYGGTFTRIQKWDEFKQAVLTGLEQGGLHVVEVPTDRAANVQMHRVLWGKVSEALNKATGDKQQAASAM